MEVWVSETLFTAQWDPFYNLPRELVFTHFFSLTSYMDPLAIKKMRDKSNKNNEVYNVLHKYIVGKVYRVFSRNHVGKHITFQWVCKT